MSLKPNEPVPELVLPLVGGGTFDLEFSNPQSFAMLVVYRGLHCPICSKYLQELEQKLEALAELGVIAIALSTDPQERAEQAKKDWNIGRLPLAYDLSIGQARNWGLYISSSIREAEPALFAEPGLFLIRPDRTLYAAWVQTTPFTRPSLDDLLSGIAYAVKHGYPARGAA